MLDGKREKAWLALRRLRDYAQARSGQQVQVSPGMLRALENAVDAFQNDPPCPVCDEEGKYEYVRATPSSFAPDPDDVPF